MRHLQMRGMDVLYCTVDSEQSSARCGGRIMQWLIDRLAILGLAHGATMSLTRLHSITCTFYCTVHLTLPYHCLPSASPSRSRNSML